MNFSGIIAGTMTWGNWGKKFNTNQMIELINCCLEDNISTFDHADIYGGYTTEFDFGKAFSLSKKPRENIQIISKYGLQITEGRNNEIKHYDYSKNYIIWSVENSLKKLQTDYLDAILLHRPSPLMEADEIAEAVEKLKKEGKIKSFGVSNFSNLQTELINQKTRVEINQIQFSATHLDAMLDGSLDFMQLNNIKPMAWNPLGNVFKEKTKKTNRLIALLKTLEIKYNTTSDVLLLAWIMKHPANIFPVIGTTNLERIKNASQATKIQLELEDWFAIWTESTGNKVP
jgi:predicted oxidoreductase